MKSWGGEETELKYATEKKYVQGLSHTLPCKVVSDPKSVYKRTHDDGILRSDYTVYLADKHRLLGHQILRSVEK